MRNSQRCDQSQATDRCQNRFLVSAVCCIALWEIYGDRADILSGAKISTFVDILGLFDLVERVLDIYFTQFPLRKACGVIGKYEKRPLENMLVVSAWNPIVHCWPVIGHLGEHLQSTDAGGGGGLEEEQ